MSKYLIVGDYHLGIDNDELLEHQIKVIDWIYKVAYKTNVDKIIHLGDFVDKRTSIDYTVLRSIQKCIQKTNKYNIPCISITGNHDTYYKNNSTWNFQDIILSKNNNFKVVTKNPKIIDGMLFVPWINSSNKDVCLDSIKNNNVKYLFGHFDVIGAKMSQIHNSCVGLNSKIFKKFKYVFSGHYHISSSLYNICYVGSPFQLNWNDYGDDKSVILFDSENGAMKRIYNKHNIFEKIKIEDDKFIYDENYYKNKKIKIYMNCDLTVKLQKVIDNIIESNISVDIISQEILLEQNENIETIINENINMSINEAVNSILDDMNDITVKDKQNIIKLFKGIQNVKNNR